MSKFVRKPINKIREPFGTAGLLVAIVALVFALAGGAYAANNLGATASKAKAGPRGKTGKTGPAGPAGPTGATGPAGPAGAAGKEGAAGKNGTNGTNGTNGKDGETGFTETLPKGATETGSWYAPERYMPELEGEELQQNKFTFTLLSFSIPLTKAAAEETEFEFIKPGAPIPAGCGGSANEPAALEGFLCMFASNSSFAGEFTQASPTLPGGEFLTGVGPTGSQITIHAENPGASWGTYAVTSK